MVVLGGAPPARADGTQARTHYERGRSYFQLGEYRQAIDEFKAAHVEKNDPAYLYNIAECHRQLGESKDAVIFYRRFISLSGAAHPLRPDAERRIVELEALPPPRVIEPVAAPPAPMVPAAPPPAAVVSPLPLVSSPAAEGRPPVDTPVPPPGPQAAAPPLAGSSPNRVPVYVLAAVGLVALGVGGYFAVDARSQWRDSEPHCPGDVCDPDGDRLSRGAQRSALIADITVGAGLVAAGTALWLFMRAERASGSVSTPVARRLRLVPQLGTEGRAGLTFASSW